MAVAASRPYHHGNLRSELLPRAERALSEGGAAELSLRDLARQAGVSHGAPRRHFADKQALLDALAQDGFERLGRTLRAAIDAAARLRRAPGRAGRAYVRFATRHAALLELMYAGKHRPTRPTAARGRRRGLRGPAGARSPRARPRARWSPAIPRPSRRWRGPPCRGWRRWPTPGCSTTTRSTASWPARSSASSSGCGRGRGGSGLEDDAQPVGRAQLLASGPSPPSTTASSPAPRVARGRRRASTRCSRRCGGDSRRPPGRRPGRPSPPSGRDRPPASRSAWRHRRRDLADGRGRCARPRSRPRPRRPAPRGPAGAVHVHLLAGPARAMRRAGGRDRARSPALRGRRGTGPRRRDGRWHRERGAVLGDATQRRPQLPAARVQEGGVEQPGRTPRRRTRALAGAEVEQPGGLGADDLLVEPRTGGRVGDPQGDALGSACPEGPQASVGCSVAGASPDDAVGERCAGRRAGGRRGRRAAARAGGRPARRPARRAPGRPPGRSSACARARWCAATRVGERGAVLGQRAQRARGVPASRPMRGPRARAARAGRAATSVSASPGIAAARTAISKRRSAQASSPLARRAPVTSEQKARSSSSCGRSDGGSAPRAARRARRARTAATASRRCASTPAGRRRTLAPS